MTREEYEKLLKSDYWRGYSYSLIKERNFTCEDCGRQFLNERNKLQVHHLVYRDTNPWSYNPDEVVVLCEECHKRRHGIIIEPDPISSESAGNSGSFSYISENNEERSGSFGNNATSYNNGGTDRDSRNPWPEKEKRKFKIEYIIYGLLALLVMNLGYNKLQNQDSANKVKYQEETIQLNGDGLNESEPQIQDQNDISSRKNQPGKAVSAKQHTYEKMQPAEAAASSSEMESVSPEADIHVTTNLPSTQKTVTSRKQDTKHDEGLSTLELLERRNHQDAMNRAKKMGLSTEGSTLEILERINHAEVVKRAQRAGVSTKGSTLDILERINHADVVKRAQRVGVSTNGSTMDILERINRAEVVKRAQSMGVSTEGSTMDILERINRKSLESY